MVLFVAGMAAGVTFATFLVLGVALVHKPASPKPRPLQQGAFYCRCHDCAEWFAHMEHGSR